jgi:hypothetical protein
MKKVYLSIIGFSILCRLSAYSQTRVDTAGNKPAFSLNSPVAYDTTDYRPRALRLDEINFVSSYYNQTGNHSAITAGIGTENVTDFSNGLELKFVWLGDNSNKNTLTTGLGFDHHTSASAAWLYQSGKGKTGGDRIYPSIDWTIENAKTGNTFGIGAYYSGEYNYRSLGADVHFSQKTADKNGEFSAKLQAYLDQVVLIYPDEFIPKPVTTVSGPTYITTASGRTVMLGAGGQVITPAIPSKPRDTYTAALSYSQAVNSRLQVMVMADVVAQNGYLSLPFHRVAFYKNTTSKDTVERLENLPSSRYKLPLGIRANYFLGDNIILRSYYRYFMDNWGTRANTANLEIVYKITPFFSISPFYRYYTQSAAKYFAPYGLHSLSDQYYTSNYEYSKFNSQFYGAGIRIAPPKGVFGWQGLHEMEIRYGHYKTTTDLASDVVSVSLGFK